MTLRQAQGRLSLQRRDAGATTAAAASGNHATENAFYGLARTTFKVHGPWVGVKVQKGLR